MGGDTKTYRFRAVEDDFSRFWIGFATKFFKNCREISSLKFVDENVPIHDFSLKFVDAKIFHTEIRGWKHDFSLKFVGDMKKFYRMRVWGSLAPPFFFFSNRTHTGQNQHFILSTLLHYLPENL